MQIASTASVLATPYRSKTLKGQYGKPVGQPQSLRFGVGNPPNVFSWLVVGTIATWVAWPVVKRVGQEIKHRIDSSDWGRAKATIGSWQKLVHMERVTISDDHIREEGNIKARQYTMKLGNRPFKVVEIWKKNPNNSEFFAPKLMNAFMMESLDKSFKLEYTVDIDGKNNQPSRRKIKFIDSKGVYEVRKGKLIKRVEAFIQALHHLEEKNQLYNMCDQSDKAKTEVLIIEDTASKPAQKKLNRTV